MMLIEETAVAQAALPLAAFRDHLRLGTGFADAGAQDAALEGWLRAAIAAIEARTAKVLLVRDFLFTLECWRGTSAQPLPVAPVAAVSAIRMRDREGNVTTVAPNRWRLVKDMARPRVAATGGILPAIPDGGQVEIAFSAGFGPAWSDVPPDLGQAVVMLAAQYYELRHEAAGATAAMPFGVMALIERWRTVRVFAGGGRA